MIFKQKWTGVRLSGGKEEETFVSSVPGNIQYDYAEAKGFGDFSFGSGVKQFVQLENDEWEYRAKLDYRAEEGERVFFVSFGIDYKYEIRLNGKTLYSYEGIFKKVELDLTPFLTGDDELRVHIFPHPKREGAKEGTRDEADSSCKPPVCYGWDWNPRLLISGMWREAYIETRKKDHIDRAEAFYTLSPELDRAEVRFEIDCASACVVSLYDPDGKLLYKGVNTTVKIERPRLWWCRGQGEQPLYLWKAESPSGSTVSGRIGFRRVKLVRNRGAGENAGFPKSRYPAPFTLELNGRRIFMKGTNFVNPEIFWGRADKERYKKLVDLAADANMNVIRLWGGASAHLPELYERCDEKGILVWQEFMLACNKYPDDEKYLSVLESEAASMIKTLRSHACLFLWCGGNELFNSWSGMSDQSLPLRLLGHLCYTLDRDRPFIMTSPTEGTGHGGYLFYDKRSGKDVFSVFRQAKNTAYTEFGIPSLSPVEELKKIIPEDELRNPSPTDAWVIHHAYGAWMPESHACFEVLEKYFGKNATLEERVAQSDFLQSEGLKFIFEEARRQSPYCSAALNWAFNEPWITAANLNIVRYPDIPKPAYHAVKSALRPSLFSARFDRPDVKEGETFEAEIWLLNDGPETVSSDAEVFLECGEKKLVLGKWENAFANANENAKGPAFSCVIPPCENGFIKLVIKTPDGKLDSEYSLICKK